MRYLHTDFARKLLFSVAVWALILCSAAASANTLTGMAAEIGEEGIALYTCEGIRFAAVSPDTVWNTDGMPEVGDVITVQYEGPDDRRILRAKTITCFRIRGTITEISESDEPYLLLLPDDGSELVRVNLGRIPLHTVASGVPATVYYNGMRTRSIPAQITADYIRGAELQGIVTETEGTKRLCLLKDDGETVILHLSNAVVLPVRIGIGDRVRVSVLPQMRLSMPPQYEVQDIWLIDEEEKVK